MLLFDLRHCLAVSSTAHIDRFVTVEADQIHRRHEILEQINAELKNDALAHMPSEVSNADAAWVVISAITHSLLCAAAGLSSGLMGKVRAQTLRTHSISIPARITPRARRATVKLPGQRPCLKDFARSCQHLQAHRHAHRPGRSGSTGHDAEGTSEEA